MGAWGNWEGGAAGEAGACFLHTCMTINRASDANGASGLDARLPLSWNDGRKVGGGAGAAADDGEVRAEGALGPLPGATSP